MAMTACSTRSPATSPTTRRSTSLAQYATLLAGAGADIVAPSDMMDGRIGAIRGRARQGRFHADVDPRLRGEIRLGLLRAVPRRPSAAPRGKGAPALDKRTYQLDPANLREALLEARLDEDQGADIIMVKPAGLYLDVISRGQGGHGSPVAAYQVSGEYAQIHAAAQAGWLDLEKARDEALLAIKRAGADIILTYFAKAVAKSLKTA